MSLVWIKVNRERKIHSIYSEYSDGLQLIGDEKISNDGCKIDNFSINGVSVLMGVVGNGHWSNYIFKNLPIKLGIIKKLYDDKTNKIVCRDFSEMFENLETEYKNTYGEHMNNRVCLSINGNLFFAFNNSNKIWDVCSSNEDFLCIGAPRAEAKTLLYYDINIDPQIMLNCLNRVTTTINTNLFKIENIYYGK
jgi:hypothetical protein